MRERPVQRYSQVFGFGTEGQTFVIEVDFQLTLSFLVEMEDYRDRFLVLSFSFQIRRYSSSVAMSLLSAPSTACQSPSACIIPKSLACA